MKHKTKLRIHRFYVLLREAMPVMIFLMLIFFGAAIIGFQKDNQRLLRDTKNIARDTQIIVSKQDDTLKAIEQLALDNKISGQELKDILTCMLVVPINQRTPDIEANCRKQAQRNTDNNLQQQPTSPQSTPSPSTPDKNNVSPQEHEQPQPNRGIIESVNSFVKNLLGIGE